MATPAAVTASRPSYFVKSSWITTDWRQSGSSGGRTWGHDIGLIHLGEGVNCKDAHGASRPCGAAGDEFGFMSMAAPAPLEGATFHAAVYGYPMMAQGSWQPHKMWGMQGEVRARSTTYLNDMFTVPSATNPMVLGEFASAELQVSGGTSGSGVLRAVGQEVSLAAVLVAGGASNSIMARLTPTMLVLVLLAQQLEAE